MDAKIKVQNRDLKGSANARRMRRDGLVPGVIYSEGKEARPVSLPKHDFEQMLHHHASDTVMVQIELDSGKEESVLVKDVQHDALSGEVMHVDLQEVAMNKALQVEVPVELVGEAHGVKQGGVLDHLMHSIEIECLPADIPENIEVDVSALNIGDILLIKDLPAVSSKITILTDEEAAVASVSMPKVAEEADGEEGEEGAAGEAAGEPEVIREKKEEEAE